MSRIAWARVLVAGLSALVLTACGPNRVPHQGGSQSGPAAQPIAALQAPMRKALAALATVSDRIGRGDLAGSRRAYQEYRTALGEFLGPASFRDPRLAQAMANANSRLGELLGAANADRQAVIDQVERAAASIRWSAQSLGVAVGSDAVDSRVRENTDRAATAAPAHTFTLRATEYRFTPSVIEVPRGTRVTVRLINTGRLKHEWELDAYGVEIKPLAPGGSGEVTFLADKPGTYQFVCDIDGHETKGMRGFLKVK